MVNPDLFRRGDIVQLNAGGPIMAVEGFEDRAGKIVCCKWFEGHAQQADVYADALKRYTNQATTTQ